MMKTKHTATISLLALATVLALPAGAEAGCVPGVSSDGDWNTCIRTRALAGNDSDSNTAIGHEALVFNRKGSANNATDTQTLGSNLDVDFNMATGT